MRSSSFARLMAYCEEREAKEAEIEKRIAAGTHRRIEREGRWGEPDLDYIWAIPKPERPLCGARCRSGRPCRARVYVRKGGKFAKRCRMHGGASTGPKTEAGRQRIIESNRRRARPGSTRCKPRPDENTTAGQVVAT